jgi:hypothetical protein
LIIIGAISGGEKEKVTPTLKKEESGYQIGEEIPCKDWVWKVISAKEEKKFQVKEGKVIKVIIEGKNVGREESSHNLILSIVDDKGRKYRNDIGYLEEKEEELKEYQILYDCRGWLPPGFSPGRCVEGFTVAKDSKGLRLHLDDPGHCEVYVNLGAGEEVKVIKEGISPIQEK